MNLTREFGGRVFRKSTRSGAGNDCVFLPKTDPLDAVADSKSGVVLALPARQLVALAQRS